MRIFGTGLLLLLMMLASAAPARASFMTARVSFYSHQLQLDYDSRMLLSEPRTIDEKVIDAAYRRLGSNNSDHLLQSLQAEKAALGLNDYLYFKLLRQAIGHVYQNRSPWAQELTLFYMLARSGYDVRLTFRDDRVYVNAYTADKIYEVPMIREDGRAYVNMSCLDQDCRGKQSLYLSRLQPNPRGRSFSFLIERLPNLPARTQTREIAYQFYGIKRIMTVSYDQTIVDIMRDYPLVNEYCYLDTPLSPTLANSLLPQLRAHIRDLDRRQAIELLASFTRSAFAYKEDTQHFGRSKPMVPEEVFSYRYSDCEDRSALFYTLVRELLDLPMAVVAYDDHLTVAVASPVLEGDGFNYKGRRYYFCDPTGPANSSAVGVVPPGYERRSFEIIGSYR